MASEVIDTPDEAEEESSRMDFELRKIGQMLRMLDDLDVPGRTRVAAYLRARYPEGQ